MVRGSSGRGGWSHNDEFVSRSFNLAVPEDIVHTNNNTILQCKDMYYSRQGAT